MGSGVTDAGLVSMGFLPSTIRGVMLLHPDLYPCPLPRAPVWSTFLQKENQSPLSSVAKESSGVKFICRCLLALSMLAL